MLEDGVATRLMQAGSPWQRTQGETGVKLLLQNPSLLGMLALLAAPSALADRSDCTAQSPAHRVVLLELYTSEGCSSCPPADRWLSSLPGEHRLAGKVVPLALHVDYWDYLGWTDAFAQSVFSARQRRLAAQAGNGVVYTPQFFMQGKPYRPPPSATALAAELEAMYSQQAPGADIALTLASVADSKLAAHVSVRLREGRGSRPAELFVALYENGLSTRVRAGENRGAILRHDFVVRQLIGPKPVTSGLEETTTFTLADEGRTGRLGVAAFIRDAQSHEVLQAISQPRCE